MSENVVLTGMVLTAMPVGDYDKRITILTTQRGKITAFARGARRPNSQLLACSNPFCFGEFELIEGRSAYTLSKANIKNYFRELTDDPLAAYTGFYFLEFASYICQENNDEKEMLRLLYQSLRALGSPKYKKELVRAVFELKAMTINGEGLQVFSCCRCGRKDHLHYLSLKRGGLLCRECSEHFPGFEISEAVLYTMQYIVSARIEKLYTFALKDEVLQELCRITDQYIKMYMNHTFKSLEILDSLVF